MREKMGTLRRTHMCGNLRPSHIGEEVVLMGWYKGKKSRFFNIFRFEDTTGICQIVLIVQYQKKFQKAEKVRSEYVLAVKGLVRKRNLSTRIFLLEKLRS